MENYLQQRKCGLIWHSTTPSASATGPPVWPSQVLNAGHHFYPCVSQDPTSFVLGMRQESTPSRASTISFNNFRCAGLGSSLLPILSEPALQCDFQMLSNPNSILTCNKGPTNLTSTIVSAQQLSQYLNSRKFNDGARIYTSSNPTSGDSIPNDMLQAVGMHPQTSELGAQTMTSHFAVQENLEESYVLRGAQISVPVTSRVMEFNNISNTGTPANVCTAPRFSSHQLSSLSSSCPRVFCLGISGYLLLSNTGLLGIVCSCHGLHMSVSKFSEHSGLCHVNPGIAVRVDSGETITQWRKAFFQRLGARAPEDDSGWDWPEGFPATVGLENHNALAPYLSMKSNLPNGFSGESRKNALLSNSYQNVVGRQLHTINQRTSQEGIFNGFIRTSHSNLNPVPNCKIAGCSILSKFDGNSSRANTAFTGSSFSNANTFMSVPEMQNFKASTVGGEGQEKASSNLELRLGQPSQQSWTVGTSTQPAFRSNQANLRSTSELTCGHHTNNNENQATFNGETCRNGHISCSAMLDKSHSICLDGHQKGFNYSNKTSCVAHNGDFDHVFLAPTGSRTTVSSQALPLRLALTDSSAIQPQSQMLSRKEGIDVKANTLDGNLKLFASQNMFKFSTQDCDIAFPTTVQEQVTHTDPCEKLYTLASLASKELSFGLNFANMPYTSSVATSSVFSCTSHPTAKDNGSVTAMTALSQGSFLVKDSEAQCHLPNHHSIHWPSLSKSGLSGVEIKATPIEQGKCYQRILPNPVILGKCDYVQTNTSAGVTKNLLSSSLDKNYSFAEKTTLGVNGMKKVNSHFFRWRDVPRKVMGTCTSMCKDKSSRGLDTETNQLKFDDDVFLGTPEESKRKRLKGETPSPTIKQMIRGLHSAVCDATANPNTLGCSKTSYLDERFRKQMIKPIVCGKYGIISNGNRSKPIKIVCLKNIRDATRKHYFTGKEKTKITRIEYMKNGIKGRCHCFNKPSNVKKVASCYPDKFTASKYCEDCHELSGGLDPCYLGHTDRGHFNEGDELVSLPYNFRKRSYNCHGKNGYATNSLQTQKKQKCKEIRKRSIYDLALHQSEAEGFYGTCMLHASYLQCDSRSNLIDTETIHLIENDSICARAEGYKGRKQEGIHYNPRADGYGGGLVPQEQLNAWLHINGQKSCTKGLPMKHSEYNYRKEYARYKQSEGWKGLIVYKSGIHALGLYTSHFIPQGAMVVEYIGEVVGLRVADKRENEYLSGKKLQYKSACYFFRIDKEHIIDATRKGGIARFVNHSCQPNCAARVISLRKEKKVVFLANRDIYPGEEITYDYHFNHEDEGKKLPCFCNSKNCRQYLN